MKVQIYIDKLYQSHSKISFRAPSQQLSFFPHPQMGLFSKDVEGSLLFEELSLQTAATCRGRQILPC